VLPGLLQSLLGYDALRSGMSMSPSGVSSMIAMIVAGALLARQVDARWLVGSGLVVMTIASYARSQMNLEIGPMAGDQWVFVAARRLDAVVGSFIDSSWFCSMFRPTCRNATAMGPTKTPMGPSAATPPRTLRTANSGFN